MGAKRFLKYEALADPQASSEIGVGEIPELRSGTPASDRLQDYLEGLVGLVLARIAGLKVVGGAPLPARKYVNVVGSASLRDNPTEDAVDLIVHGLTTPLSWSAGTQYDSYQIVRHLGSSYFVAVDHVAQAGQEPGVNTARYALLAEKGGQGAGPGGTHGPTHAGDGSDPVPNATQSVAGAMSPSDKTKLDSIDPSLVQNPENFALADGTRLRLAASVASPALRQLRLNGAVIEHWDGDSWEPSAANLRSGASVPYSQLSGLAIGAGDLAPGHSLIVHCTSLSRPVEAVEGQLIYETDTELYFKNVSETFAAPEWQPLVPAGSSGHTPGWVAQTGVGAKFAAYGDGNPNAMLSMMDVGLPAVPNITQLGNAHARARRFRLPKTLNLASVKMFAHGACGAVLRVGIFREPDGAKVWESALFSTTASSIVSLPVSGATILGGEDHLFCWTTTLGSGSQIPFRTPAAPFHQDLFGAGDSPFALGGVGAPVVVRFANASAGAFPTSLPALAAASWANTTGSVPPAILEGQAA